VTDLTRRGGPARNVRRASTSLADAEKGSRRRRLIAACLGSLLCAFSVNLSPARAPTGAPPPFDGTLSVLTYNVKGIPWPIARGRGPAMDRIAGRLRDLRRSGANPHIVLLQEAFSGDARAIGGEAGYRYRAEGPSASDVAVARPDGADEAFLAAASWRKGETQGKLLGSGLQILSDYPISSVHRMAWPAFACAGFDCLAEKGALIATVELPGAPSPVDIVTAHLNSLNSSGVPEARSLYAYRRQAILLAGFIRRWHDPARPLVVAGDFNVHLSPRRRLALLPRAAGWGGGPPVREALHVLARSGAPLPPDARSVLRLGRDWQFFASGTRARLGPVGVRILFGPDAAGPALSDHVGYAASFRIGPAGPSGLAARPAAKSRG
jgi:endonuclease/exonuclease/phosphatase family metal-dependent hydrolase